MDDQAIIDTEENVITLKEDNVVPAAGVDSNDPYFYTNQNMFTSEIYKIELHNLPKFFGLGELRKLLTQNLGLDANKVKPAGPNSVFICFRSQEAKEAGVQALSNFTWRGCLLHTTDAKPAKDPLMLKRKKMTQEGANPKVPKFATPEEYIQDCIVKLNEAACPYWKTPYEEQLKIKMRSIMDVMGKLGSEMVKCNRDLYKWNEYQKTLHNGAICSVEEFKTTDEINGYRNRCEFTIGINAATRERCVGFRLGSYASGDCTTFPPNECLHISDIAKKSANVFEKYVAASKYLPFDPVTRSGHFRTLTVRTSRQGHLMITLDFNTSDMSEEEVSKIKESYMEFFVSGPGKELNVTSLNFKRVGAQTKKSDVAKAAELVHGEKFIVEEMLGLQFEISPNSFFQVNTTGAELLYSTISELAAPDLKTTVLDICCGTGTIGISMAKDAGQVLGVECVPVAIENAKKNAEKNGLLDKCDFFLGNAQTALQPTIVRAKYDNIVAVLDPPRPGVVPAVLNVIRATWKIKRLVFVACNFESSYKNVVHLTKAASKQTPGDPFLPMRVIPIDMFPHTRHFEVVIYMERKSVASLVIPKPVGTVVCIDDETSKEDAPANDVAKDITKVADATKTTEPSPAKGSDVKEVDNLLIDLVDEAPKVKISCDEPKSSSTVVSKMVKTSALKHMTPRDAKRARKREKNNLQRVMKEAYAQAKGIDDPKKVLPKEIVQLFAHSVTQVEFATMINQNVLRPKPFEVPRPQKQQYLERPAPFLATVPPTPINFPLSLPMHTNFRGNFNVPQQRPTLNFGTQTDSSKFMSAEELQAAEDLGYKWGCRVPDRVLHDLHEMKQEEEEAVQKFREGFLVALKNKQRLMIEAYEKERSVQTEVSWSAPRETTDAYFSNDRVDYDSTPFQQSSGGFQRRKPQANYYGAQSNIRENRALQANNSRQPNPWMQSPYTSNKYWQ